MLPARFVIRGSSRSAHSYTIESRASELTPKFFKFSDVIGLIVFGGSQDQSDRVRGEVPQGPPHHLGYIQPVVRPVQKKHHFGRPVVEYDLEATGERNNDLLRPPECMAAANLPSRDIV